MSWESNLKQYFAAFEASKRDFSEVEPLFDSLYHEDFTFISKDGKTLNRDDVKELHAGCYSMGIKLQSFTFKRIASDSIDVLFRSESLEGGDRDNIVHAVYSIEDNKVTKCEVVNECFSSVAKAPRRSSCRFHEYTSWMNKYHWYAAASA